jgi:glycosyltransferase involved in cell wall biosynthesis
MLDALRTHRIDVAFLWSVWPETFCFTLHEAMAAGCYVVTNPNSGNIQATVVQANCGKVFASEEEVVAWFESGRLIQAARKFRNEEARFGSLVLTPGSYKIVFGTEE